MRTRKRKGRKTRVQAAKSPGPEIDVTTIDPDELRRRVIRALSGLSEKERQAMYEHLLTRLDEVGVNIASLLFQLGIGVTSHAELTPADIASLLRSVRLISPDSLRQVSPALTVLVAAGRGQKQMCPARLAA
ncbi:MAG TPA: hypothetical protein VFD58_24065 [Blastocatellia bacterium]|nr:hypothetical protein [Blastocatellia bacterium]